MGLLQVADDFKIDTLDFGKIDLLDMHQAQKLADGLRHLTPAFIARSAALRDADPRPELFLVEAEPTPNLARIEYAFKEFHVTIRLFFDGL